MISRATGRNASTGVIFPWTPGNDDGSLKFPETLSQATPDTLWPVAKESSLSERLVVSFITGLRKDYVDRLSG
jgi:hypothetical protein